MKAIKQNETLPEGVILYRGEIPGIVLDYDGYGCYGEYWTTDPNQLATFGHGLDRELKACVKKAILPKKARRLLFEFVDDAGWAIINWEAVNILAELMADNPYLKTMWERESSYEIWQDEWTLALKEAGYDSFSTVSLDGWEEEYVLNPDKLILLAKMTPEEFLLSVQ